MYPGSLLGKGRLFALLLPLFTAAQTRYTGTAADLLISGTSTLHDWTMKSSQASCTATFNLSPDGQVSTLDALSFSTPATALKSEHSGMDNNAYKALKTDKNPTISYTLTAVTLSKGGGALDCKGRLTIAGATRDEDVVAVCKTNADNTITVTGTKKISMKDYQIDPPTFAFGTVKTGNDIVLTFHLILKKS